MQKTLRATMAVGMLACGCATALANDSVAGLGAGGVILGRTDAVAMESEDLFISLDEVQVDYVFHNTSEADVETIVAFPMPDIAASTYSMPNLPDSTADNFLGFEVTVDRRHITPDLDQRATAVGVDVTDELSAHGVPVNPFTPPAFEALAVLPETVIKDWIDRGLVMIDSYDEGAGWKNVRTPLWTLKSTYWWKMRFAAGERVDVSHHYRPSVGASVGLGFYSDGGFQESYGDYKQKYCVDESFEKAVQKAATASPDGYPKLSENRLQYVLTTGGNWALGTIAKFHLTIDKGDPKNLLSLCANGMKKTGPTRFELSEVDYNPQHDLDILILKPWDDSERGGAVAVPERKRRSPPAGVKP